MAFKIFPPPLPDPYGPEGLDQFVREKYHCLAKWRCSYDGTLPAGPKTMWSGFVHEFELESHAEADTCYVVPYNLGDSRMEIWTYLKDDRVTDAEAAARWMIADRARRQVGGPT